MHYYYVKHKIRALKKTMESEGKFKITYSYLKDKFLSSIILRITIGAFTIAGVFGNWIYDKCTNPPITITVEGSVAYEGIDNQLFPLKDALITAVDKKANTVTDSLGVFKLDISMKKNDKSIEIVCSKNNYEYRKKTIYIPLDDDPENPKFETTFHLEYKGYSSPELPSYLLTYTD